MLHTYPVILAAILPNPSGFLLIDPEAERWTSILRIASILVTWLDNWACSISQRSDMQSQGNDGAKIARSGGKTV